MPNLTYYKTGRPFEKFKKMIEENIEDAFDAFLNTYAPDDRDDIKIALYQKDLPGTAKFIMDYAKENKSDFIIIGAKGHTKVELLLMGSVTESFLQLNDTIPILIVK